MRQLGRAELQLAVVAQDHVLHQRPQLRRKIGQAAQLLRHHAQGDRDMPDQLPVARVREPALVIQLVDLADVVQHHAGEQKVAVDVGVVRRRRARQGAQRKHVLDQPAQIRVVDLLGGGRPAVAPRDVLIVQHRIEQRLQMGVARSPPRSRATPPTSPPGSRREEGK